MRKYVEVLNSYKHRKFGAALGDEGATFMFSPRKDSSGDCQIVEIGDDFVTFTRGDRDKFTYPIYLVRISEDMGE
jgi:hypothetical protein